MNPECERVRQTLREQFDAGEELGAGADAHVSGCDDCGAYLQRLRALEKSFADVAIEAPAPDLIVRIQDRLQGEQAGATRTRRGVAAVLASAFVAAAALGWFFPLTADLDALGNALQIQPAAWDWSAALYTAQDGLRLAWDNVSAQLGLLSGLPTIALWSGLVASILALALFNAVEAASVRNHSDGAPHGYRIAK